MSDQAFHWPALSIDADRVRQLAHEEGLADGQRMGLEAGRKEAEEEIRTMRRDHAEALQRLADARHDIDAFETQTIVVALRTICESLLEREMDAHDERPSKVVEQALRQLGAELVEVEVHVAPDALDAYGEIHGIRLIGDESVPSFGCRIVSPAAVADIDPIGVVRELFQELMD